MTNITHEQYEKESVMRALKQHDDVITSLENALHVAQESRREFINRNNLNKCQKNCAGCKCGEPDQHANMVD